MRLIFSNGLKGLEPLLIDPTKASDYAARLDKYGFSEVLSKLLGARPEAYVTPDGKGVIPIDGPIGRGISPLESMLGAADVLAISKAIDEMEADPAVKKIAFRVNSPGGTVAGVPELANKIRRMKKPTMAYGEEANSAALWLAAAADKFTAMPSGSIGSVGVYMVVPDYSKAYADAGVRMVVIKSSQSPLKGAGIEGTTLTEAQVADLQRQVDGIAEDFQQSVKATRVNVSQDAFTGGTFSGREAVRLGLVTGLADSFEEALAAF
jgi:ClpP class serine protease